MPATAPMRSSAESVAAVSDTGDFRAARRSCVCWPGWRRLSFISVLHLWLARWDCGHSGGCLARGAASLGRAAVDEEPGLGVGPAAPAVGFADGRTDGGRLEDQGVTETAYYPQVAAVRAG